MRRAVLMMALAVVGCGGANPPSTDRLATEPTSSMSVKESDFPDTVAWWCVDLSKVLNVDVPLVVGKGVLTAPTDSPVPPCASVSSWPIEVPAGSPWSSMVGTWTTNWAYTKEMRAALESRGFHFVSASPVQDLLAKMTEVRYEVTLLDNTPVATYRFDPRDVHRQLPQQRLAGSVGLVAASIPELGIKVNEHQTLELPTVAFPAIGEPLPPGRYKVCVHWVMSELHNDGLGLEDGNFLPAGDRTFGCPVFVVTP